MFTKKLVIFENKEFKSGRSENYNFNFNKETGYFERWGKTKQDDPECSPAGPEILDIEISTICNGIHGKPCPWCYKSNSGVGENMSFEKFKDIFHKIPHSLTQIAFGIGDLDGNPDLWKIMSYCRTNKYNFVVPNITINGYNLTDSSAAKLVDLCGAVSVSMYKPKDICYDAIKKLTDRGLKQVNIHRLVSAETYDDCMEVMIDSKKDSRLKDLNAIVFLALKPIGDRNRYTKLGDAKFKTLIDYAFKNKIRVGFDSCSAPMFLKAVEKSDTYTELEQMSEPCESYLFSFYINVKGKTTPCSFLEKSAYPEIDVATCNNFLKDIWYSKPVKEFRKKLLKTTNKCVINGRGCRSCPEYDIY